MPCAQLGGVQRQGVLEADEAESGRAAPTLRRNVRRLTTPWPLVWT